MIKIRTALVGVGNCASSLVQGLHYYREAHLSGPTEGLMHPTIGPYTVAAIDPVVAIDVDRRKVGLDLSKAILASPNCTPVFAEVPHLGVPVVMGPLLDGVSDDMLSESNHDYPTFQPGDDDPVDVVQVLRDQRVDVVINYLPVGSQAGTRFYAASAIKAGCAFVNAIPVFIASDPMWAAAFEAAGLPVVGADVKSQFGATYAHRVLVQGFVDRGVHVSTTSQENYGGNADFRNMMNAARLADKLASKTDAIQNRIPYSLETPLYAGPGSITRNKVESGHGFMAALGDTKEAIINVVGSGFGGLPVEVRCEIRCVDSPNSGGVIVDAVRCAKLAMDRGLAGSINPVSAWLFKHPLVDQSDSQARADFQAFLESSCRDA